MNVAFAEGVMMDTRYDLNGTSYNEVGQKNGISGGSAFQGSRLRLLLHTKMKDDLSSKVRLNLLAANDTPSTEAKFSRFVDYAFVSHQINPHVNMTGGKVIAAIGGREALTNPGDYYFASIAGAEILGRPLAALWPVGVTLSLTKDDHKLELLAANTTTDEGTSQSRTMTGASFLGSYFEKSFQPIASYHLDSENENTENRSYLNIGSKFVWGSFEIELDYLANRKQYKTWTAAASKEVKSIVSTIKYKANENWIFIAKVDSSTDDVASAAGTNPTFNQVKYSQQALTAEYYPYADLKFRYHLAALRIAKPIAGEDLIETRLVAGLRLNHDFLK